MSTTWNSNDITFDENGCLLIKNPELAEKIRKLLCSGKDLCVRIAPETATATGTPTGMLTNANDDETDVPPPVTSY